jgi:hypothetical protein
MPTRSSKTRLTESTEITIAESRALTEKTRKFVVKSHDFTTIARNVVEQAIGERLNGSPLPEKDAGKNPAAVALGRLGGMKGGKARAEALSPRRRRQIAFGPGPRLMRTRS